MVTMATTARVGASARAWTRARWRPGSGRFFWSRESWTSSTSSTTRRRRARRVDEDDDDADGRRHRSLTRARRLSASASSSSTSSTRTVVAEDEDATRAVARALAAASRTGDCVCLRGAVGAGKSAFARAFVRAVCEDETMDVPSPTYLVQQRYEGRDGREVHHYDLYRLRDEGEVEAMVDLGESARRATALFEWSERLGTLTPRERLEVYVRAAEAGETFGDDVERAEGAETVACDDDDDEEAYDDDDDVDDAYVDNAARVFRFVAIGGDWASRLASVRFDVNRETQN